MPLPDSLPLESSISYSAAKEVLILQMLLAHFFRYLSSSVKALHKLICRMCQTHISSYDLYFHPFSTKNTQKQGKHCNAEELRRQ